MAGNEPRSDGPDAAPGGERLSGLRAQVYQDPRPAEAFAVFHRRTRTREPNFVYEIVRTLTSLYGTVAFRARGIDAHLVPAQGPVILAPNHSSFMDHFFVGMFLRRQMQFMAKSQLFRWPMQVIYSHGGVFPVRRGRHDEEAFITAHAVLARGGCVVMYCEGGRSRTGRIADRARPGIGRLALESGAQVVPVAVHGSHRVRNWKRLQFPRVTVRYGEPLAFGTEDQPDRAHQQEVADQVLAAIKQLHAGLEDPSLDLRGRAGRGAIRSLIAG